jgi:hypothetical protein
LTVLVLDFRRPRAGEWLALVAALALLLCTFLPWYAPGRSAWEAFGALDVYLLLTALVAGALWTVSVSQEGDAVSVVFAALTTLLGAIAAAWISVRLLLPPADLVDRLPGAVLGLASALGVLVGGALAMREDPPLEGEARRRAVEREAARAEVLPRPAGSPGKRRPGKA